MPILFPTSPTLGQVFTSGGRSWVWNGSAWDAPTATNTLLAPYGLELVKQQVVGTGVSSVIVSDAFNSTYDAYKVIWVNGVGSTAGFMTFRFGTASTEYYQTRVGWSYAGVQNVGFDNNQAQFTVMARYSSNHLSCQFDVVNPFAARHTLVHSGNDVGETAAGVITGIQRSNTSFTSFTLFANSGTVTGGTIYVYGYRKS